MAPDIPVKRVGSPADRVGAQLVREPRSNELRTAVYGTQVNGGSEYTGTLVLRDRAQLKALIDALQGVFYGWPGDER
ncbi:hypothetical protein SEA_HEATHER_46 [Streptomyces phage Heather]|uniref:Uncharacterized protein n=1 Tax=Streptomyces phage Heather TaxID=2562343 RepID=A0A4D6E487_9CAUD|nr:hypothetical protein SEA_HEATHER_46 [Streptomyces phage Heather]